MSDYKKFEGSVSVEGDLTPITRQKIESVDSTDWDMMTVGQLYDQRIVLTNRMQQAAQSSFGAMAIKQMQTGLAQIDTLIAQKASKDIDLI